MGFVVAGIYVFTRPRHDTGTKGLIATLVMLSILLSMVVMAVGDNAARAFTLAGVLAIVRFRSVVEDTRDAAFVICSVIVGMASGAGYWAVALIGLPFVAVAAYLTQNHQVRKVLPASTLKLKFTTTQPMQQPIEAILHKYSEQHIVKSTGTCKKGTAFEVTYRLRLRHGSISFDLVRDLRMLTGMQQVEWKG
ncbi:MAG TPA: DUF4956 domain-containing protein [Gemmatales bacterium]|nr:DUF4956 domain-containing protein [Gemmatales bacterium]